MDIDDTFNTICRILFQSELGRVDEFQELLKRYTDPVKQTNSTLSGKEVYYSEPYCDGAKFISLDEMSKLKIEPLKSYEMNDIDALVNAIQERFYYAGNKIVGTSQDVNEGENCIDSFHVHKSREIFNSEYIIHSQMILDSKFMIGSSWGAECNFCINVTEMYRLNRCFETAFAMSCNDAYFSFNCKNCNEIMFCFNQFSRRHSIGNNPLPKEKYYELKKKLLGEIADDLKRKKSIPSLVDFSLGDYK